MTPEERLAHIVRLIDKFDAYCDKHEYTDVGDAWTLLYMIKDTAEQGSEEE